MYSYHKGELFVQQKANVVKQAARTSRIIQEEVDFYAQGFIQISSFVLCLLWIKTVRFGFQYLQEKK